MFLLLVEARALGRLDALAVLEERAGGTLTARVAVGQTLGRHDVVESVARARTLRRALAVLQVAGTRASWTRGTS